MRRVRQQFEKRQPKDGKVDIGTRVGSLVKLVSPDRFRPATWRLRGCAAVFLESGCTKAYLS